MKKSVAWSRVLVLALMATTLIAANPAGMAQEPQQAYDLSWWTVDAGGITFATGGGYSLGGTAGQPDAGVLSGGGYSLGGGFWRGGAPAQGTAYRSYLPLVVR
jgi:hypothetical protein